MPRRKHRADGDRAADGRRLYSLGDVVEVTGITAPQGRYWVRTRLIPADYPGAGQGNFSGFTFRNLVEFEICHRLSSIATDTRVMQEALSSLRAADEDDWYSNMPRMAAAIDAVPKKRKPTKKAALRWLDERLGSLKGSDFTDPELTVDVDRYFEAAGLEYPSPSDTEEQREAEKLARWRAFKEPATRGDSDVTLCCGAVGFLAFSHDALHRYIHMGVPAVALSLAPIFAYLETKTGDHWNKRE
jgi:hypothetical protein